MWPERPWSHGRPALAVRGSIGRAFRHLVCTFPRVDCQSCVRQNTCEVPAWFEPPGDRRGPRPWWIRADTSGEISSEAPLVWHLQWIGEAPRDSLVFETLLRMAAAGLGSDRIPHRLDLDQQVDGGHAPLVFHGVPTGRRIAPTTLADLLGPAPTDELVWELGPTRLRRRRRVIREPSVSDLLRAGMERVRGLCRTWCDGEPEPWPHAGEIGGFWLERGWSEASRYSRNGASQVDLSGATGVLRLSRDDVGPWWDLVSVIPVVQLGRATTAGLGVVRQRS